MLNVHALALFLILSVPVGPAEVQGGRDGEGGEAGGGESNYSCSSL